jgi:trk system potassium uptake protein TrkA
MKQFAIIGLGSFGLRMLEELLPVTNEIIIIDKDRDIIDKYRDLAKASYITDVINEKALLAIIPREIDAVIVDLGGKIEASIMAINYLKKMGIREIIAKAHSDEHGEVLSIVGATKVVFPDQEAAKRITPMLTSAILFNYMPISVNLALAEVRANEFCIGKTLLEANLRKTFALNVVAMRKLDTDSFSFISDPAYVFTEDDVLLVAGSEENIFKFSNDTTLKSRKKISDAFRHIFQGKPKA